MKKIILPLALWAALQCPALAQVVGGYPAVIPLGHCQLSVTSSPAVAISAATCASFTATGAGTVLTASAVTGFIGPGAALAGTGVVAGTTIVKQLTGPNGGAGTYQTSQATTSSGNALTTSGIPQDVNGHPANMMVLSVETAAVRWHDDGSPPTTAVGMPIAAAAAPMTYLGALANFQLIAQSTTALVDAAFYRLP